MSTHEKGCDKSSFSSMECTCESQQGWPDGVDAVARLMKAAPALLDALEQMECACCNHLLKYHVSKYGCEVERGDAWVTGNQASAPTVLMAQGPCGCNASYGPPLDPATFAQELRAIAAIRLAKGVVL